ncbi:MAG: carboxypeptidase regulatory-like domain-containing protein [Gammaproteobacteria bacterium]|nr:carboxypeptidase regulatory-like domain-containing protein [Gammaproteobacteria bacterium]MCF6363472.1 carboxypeptidase regulatory-like domain-containing protein [Gammaproteobacteria bacterium]
MKKTLPIPSLCLAACLPLNTGAYDVVPVDNGGRIDGKVVFQGTDPAPRQYIVAKDADTCGTGTRSIDFVRVNNGALMDAVVYLHTVNSGKAFPAGIDNAELNQEKCAFTPFLGVMKDGSQLTVKNSDPVLHNIHTYEIIGRAKKTVFNISQPGDLKTFHKQVSLRRGTAMKVECDAHDFMHSFSFVTKNPYFAVVDENGGFSIDNVPPGRYKIRAWHGTLGEKKGTVTVEANGMARIDFVFKGK